MCKDYNQNESHQGERGTENNWHSLLKRYHDSIVWVIKSAFFSNHIMQGGSVATALFIL